METCALITCHLRLNKQQTVPNSSIIQINSDVNYSTFCLADGTKVLVSKTLGDIETLLSENNNFLRPHKKYIINTNFIKALVGSEIVLHNGETLPISRRKKREITDKLKHLLTF